MDQRKWLVFPLAGLAGALVLLAPFPVRPPEPTHRTIRLEASQFAYTPGIIRVNPGDTVTIELVSMDVVHGFYLDGYDASVTADPGQTASLTFTAGRSGSYRFRCNVTCGPLHPFMVGRFQVGPNMLLWRLVALAVLAALTMVFLRPRFPQGGTG